jgi:fumarylacetoacetase
MSRRLDETHDPALSSWVESSNLAGCEFPIQNLPFGVFRDRTRDGAPRIGVAIGDQALDLRGATRDGLLAGLPGTLRSACAEPDLNALLALGPPEWSLLRRRLSEILREDAPQRFRRADLLTPIAGVELCVPARIGDFTDFYASLEHATNVGRMFRPENPLLLNYKHVPIAYHGRSSSIVPSGTPVRRPCGQRVPPGSPRAAPPAPEFGPTRLLDYELEVGALVGPGNRLGEPIPVGEAEEHIFGLVLVNDWSARDIQAWEYQPLGPFLSKSFATTVSLWVVTLEALAPFRTRARARDAADPQPLAYLRDEGDEAAGGFDLLLEVYLHTDSMRRSGTPAFRISRQSFRGMYWTFAQMLAHHTSNGCNLRAGDLLASGTVSGPTDEALGCLLEITRRGERPLALPSGETRTFLEDGDEVILRGRCEAVGRARIGFGECRGMVASATAAAAAVPPRLKLEKLE